MLYQSINGKWFLYIFSGEKCTLGKNDVNSVSRRLKFIYVRNLVFAETFLAVLYFSRHIDEDISEIFLFCIKRERTAYIVARVILHNVIISIRENQNAIGERVILVAAVCV